MLRNITKRLRLASALVAFVVFPALAEQANMADSFVDSIGVQTHLEDQTSPYWSNFTGVVNAIKNSGIRHIRDGFWTQKGANQGLSIISQVYAATGVNVHFLFTESASDCTATGILNPNTYVPYGFSPSQIDAFEGLNEWNGFCQNNTNPTWYQAVDSAQQTLAGIVRGTSNISSIPIVGPSINSFVGVGGQKESTNQANLVGNLTSYMTYRNVHDYCGNNKPSCNFAWQPSSLSGMNGSGAVWLTEGGYTNTQLNQAQSGNYFSRFWFENYNHGYVRSFAYELFDESQKSGGEAQFGLLNSDGTPKPAFTTVSNTISLLKNPGASFTPGTLNYTLSGGPAALHHTLLQKRNGTFYLALWLEYNYWDTFSPATVTVNFTGAQHVNQYNPLTSVSPKTAWNNVSAVVLTVSDQATILEISPSVAAPPTASLTSNPASIAPGGSSTLAWGSTNATSCTGAGFSTGGGASGTTSVSPTATTNYSVSCTGSGGTASASATVALAASTFFTVSSPANGANVAGTVTITGATGTQWVNVACYTTTAKVCPDATPSGGTYSLTLDTTKLPYGSNTLNVMAFSIPAGQPGGTVATVTLTLNVNNSPPTASLTASPTSIAPGGSSTLAWGSSNATSCTGVGFSTGGGASGTTSVSPTATTNYSVSCTGSGGTASASATVAVTTSTFFTVSSPANGATVAGIVTVTGATGTQWVNVACYTTNGTKMCPDATPSGGAYSLTLDTTKLPNGSNALNVMAFSVPAGQPGYTVTEVTLTLNVKN
jgi:hypothetical protein